MNWFISGLGLFGGGLIAIFTFLFVINLVFDPYLNVTVVYQDDEQCIIEVEGHDREPILLGGSGVRDKAVLSKESCLEFLRGTRSSLDWDNAKRS